MKPRALFAHTTCAVAENLRFFTRLPLGSSPRPPDFSNVAWAAPLAGAAVGVIAAAIFWLSREIGFPTLVSATLAVAAEIAVTGALHEDGLADVADGFGGGQDRDAKLAIMRDSRIGAYGAVVLGLVLLLRVEATAALGRPYALNAAAALVFGGAAARAAALAPLAWLSPARTDGAGASAGRLGLPALRDMTAWLALIAAALGIVSLGVVRALFACVVAAAVVRLFAGLARRQIGGQTGDVCGAAAALGQLAVLLALLIGGRDA